MCLLCFLKCVLFFYILRFKSDEERTPVYHIVEETFPHLLNIFNRLVQIVNPPLDVADLIKLICKIFWSSIYVRAKIESFAVYLYTWVFILGGVLIGYQCSHFILSLNSFWINCKYIS